MPRLGLLLPLNVVCAFGETSMDTCIIFEIMEDHFLSRNQMPCLGKMDCLQGIVPYDPSDHTTFLPYYFCHSQTCLGDLQISEEGSLTPCWKRRMCLMIITTYLFLLSSLLFPFSFFFFSGWSRCRWEAVFTAGSRGRRFLWHYLFHACWNWA